MLATGGGRSCSISSWYPPNGAGNECWYTLRVVVSGNTNQFCVGYTTPLTYTLQGHFNECYDIRSYNKLTVSPNPVGSTLNVSFNKAVDVAGGEKAKATAPMVAGNLEILNSAGAVLKTIKNTKADVQIPTEGLPKGVNYVRFTSTEGTVTKRVVLE